jgi:hypothetical protein
LTVKIVLRNPLDHRDQVDYVIEPADNALAQDWTTALKELLRSGNLLEKNFCFMGFPKTARTLEYLCQQLDQAVRQINQSNIDYQIEETYSPDTITTQKISPDLPGVPVIAANHDVLNLLHNHFEILQGTVNQLSEHYLRADYETKYAIRQLNNICHEIETLILSQRRSIVSPVWVRPSQITTFLAAPRYDLKDKHRDGFVTNGYDRVLGGVYMHWAQIGKTLYEVFRDEGAPELTDTVCEAITELKYYSGEFDIEWGNDVVYGGDYHWHDKEQERFRAWLTANGRDWKDPKLSLGYLPIGQVQLQNSFGSTSHKVIWDIMSSHLDIYKIEVDGVSSTFDYCWTDSDYKQQQINMMRPGYDYHSRNTK